MSNRTNIDLNRESWIETTGDWMTKMWSRHGTLLQLVVFLSATILLALCGAVAEAEEPPGEEVCVERQKLIEHQDNLTSCERKKDQYEGRLQECRDSVEPLQVRVEDLAGDKGKLQRQRNGLQRELKKWYRNPLIWGAIAMGMAGGGYAAGHILD